MVDMVPAGNDVQPPELERSPDDVREHRISGLARRLVLPTESRPSD
jgi:hypothetical protein